MLYKFSFCRHLNLCNSNRRKPQCYSSTFLLEVFEQLSSVFKRYPSFKPLEKGILYGLHMTAFLYSCNPIPIARFPIPSSSGGADHKNQWWPKVTHSFSKSSPGICLCSNVIYNPVKVGLFYCAGHKLSAALTEYLLELHPVVPSTWYGK